MFARSVRLLANARKLALRLYREEQIKSNSTLELLSPSEKSSLLSTMFEALPTEEIEALKVRAAALQPAKQVDIKGGTATGKKRNGKPKVLPSVVEVTPYEFFVKEQSGNPAVAAATTPREREVLLLQIYNTLPDKARDALEQRTVEYNNRRMGIKVVPAKRAVSRLKRPRRLSKKTLDRLAREAKRAAARATKEADKENKAKEREERKQLKANKKKRKASPYALYVKEQMPSLQHLDFKERMIEVAKRWKALSEEERQRLLSKGVAAQKQAHDAETTEAETKSQDEGVPTPATAPAAAPSTGEETKETTVTATATSSLVTEDSESPVEKKEEVEVKSQPTPATPATPSPPTASTTTREAPQVPAEATAKPAAAPVALPAATVPPAKQQEAQQAPPAATPSTPAATPVASTPEAKPPVQPTATVAAAPASFATPPSPSATLPTPTAGATPDVTAATTAAPAAPAGTPVVAVEAVKRKKKIIKKKIIKKRKVAASPEAATAAAPAS